MSAKKLRRIIVANAAYLYRSLHQHDAPDSGTSATPHARCREIFVAYREGCKRSPLRASFVANDRFGVGYPARGVVQDWSDPEKKLQSQHAWRGGARHRAGPGSRLVASRTRSAL